MDGRSSSEGGGGTEEEVEKDGADGLASGEMLGIMWHEGDEGAQGKRKAV